MTATELQSKSFSMPFGPLGAATEYFVDAAQRSILFWDVMRQRGNAYREHLAETAPHVLEYKVELVLDGRNLARPVNYVLVRVIPPQGVKIDRTRRPFVVVDPRAGHGPGIGGFKSDSEIGVALKAGHPCYFVGFSPDLVTASRKYPVFASSLSRSSVERVRISRAFKTAATIGGATVLENK